MTEALDSLEVRIELAWDKLTDLERPRRRTLWLTKDLRIFGFKFGALPPSGAVEIGTYNREVDLADFRMDVFHARKMIKDPHG